MVWLSRKESPPGKLSATIPNSRKSLFESWISTPKRKSSNEIAASSSKPKIPKEPAGLASLRRLGERADGTDCCRRRSFSRSMTTMITSRATRRPSIPTAASCSWRKSIAMGRRGALDREKQRNLLAVHPARAIHDGGRQQIMGVFNGFERTLLDTSNVDFNAPPPEVDADLAEINWEEDRGVQDDRLRLGHSAVKSLPAAVSPRQPHRLARRYAGYIGTRPTSDQLQIEKLLGNHDPVQAILDYISTSKNMKQLQNFYETTLEALKDAKNNRLWFKTNTKLGKLFFDRNDFGKLQKILKQLHQSCLNNYDEYGSSRRTTCLKYLVLANVLKRSGINPFDSQEAKPHKNGPEILSMTNLIVSYKNNDIMEFESILRNNRNNTMADPFIREHIENLLRNSSS
ncbi:uncharacterized protein LOC6044501 [Culex quinquefasciatus]|uniref:uncharacterized protein LOC6044501 n=1 Tax=Culex quinquefasciatus TaxID=7176 RepID=UPI0018E3A4A6|nr:uncharacterized protein LOC6044501 [Culex quinquefasciatus]